MSRVITPSTNVRNFGPTEVLLLLLDAIYNITNGNRWLTKIIYCINNNLGVTFKDHISNTHIPCKKYTFPQSLSFSLCLVACCTPRQRFKHCFTRLYRFYPLKIFGSFFYFFFFLYIVWLDLISGFDHFVGEKKIYPMLCGVETINPE